MTTDATSPAAASRRTAATRLVVARYIRQARRTPLLCLAAIVLPGVGNVFAHFVPPLVIARVLGHLMEVEDVTLASIAPWLAIFAASWAAGEVIWRVAIHLLIASETRGINDLYNEAMEELLDKDLSFFHDSFAGSLTKRAVGYAKQYEEVFDTIGFSIMGNAVPFVLVVPVLWWYSPWLVALLLGALALAASILRPLIRRRQHMVITREEAAATVAGHVADTLSNMDAVRVFGQEPAELATHKANVADWAAKAKRSWNYHNLRIDVATSPIYVATNALGVLVAALIGRRGAVGFESVFITFTYFALCTRVMWDFNEIYRNVESAMSEAAQFTELLLDEPTVLDPDEAEPLAPRDTSVRFEGVRFRHRPDLPLLFDRFDLTIEPGEKVGLVGRSGGGKSSLTHLLLRLMDVEGGVIRIGGQDITRMQQSDLRALIAYVPQDPAMFHRSLRDNIAFGRPDASDEDIRAAARASHAAEFIETLPDGYDTLVGERGVKLSGGQRQRIAIARALLRRAPILVLDEATSSLDSESEAFIQPALLSVMEHRTALVIAHRLSTVQRLDRLVVLEQGRVIEQGTHHELLAEGGTYAGLWRRQSGGFLADATEPVGVA